METYLILTVPEFEIALQPLINHRSSEYNIIVRNVTGMPINSIKSLIQSYSANLKYVLIVGNSSIIPTFIYETSYTNYPSDNYYVDFDNDGVPEFALGRLPINNTEDLNNIIEKIIYFENSEYYNTKNALFLPSTDRPFPTEDFYHNREAEICRDYLISNGWNTNIINCYVDSTDYGVCDEECRNVDDRVIESINEGKSFILYVGHSGLTGWRVGCNSLFNTWSLENLINENKYPIIISCSCTSLALKIKYGQKMSVDMSKKDFVDMSLGNEMSFGNAFLTKENGGCVAYIGGTSASGGFIEFGYNIIKSLLNYTLGDAFLNAKQLPSSFWVRPYDGSISNLFWYKTYLYCINLLGDPALKLRREPIQIPKISVNSNPIGANVFLDEINIGTTPLSDFGISPGTHALKLTKTGYEDYEETFTIAEGETRTFDIELVEIIELSFISVNSNPQGANVYLNGNLVGTTPLSDFEINPGEYTLKLTKTGYEDYEETFTIAEGETRTFDKNLVALPVVSNIIFYIYRGERYIRFKDYAYANRSVSIRARVRNYGVEEGYARLELINRDTGETIDIDDFRGMAFRKRQSKSGSFRPIMPSSVDLPERVLRLKLNLYENDVLKEGEDIDINLQEGIGHLISINAPSEASYRDRMKIYVTFKNIGIYRDNIFFRIIDNDTEEILSIYRKTLNSGREYERYRYIRMPDKTLNFRVECGHIERRDYIVEDISNIYTIQLI